MRGGLIFISTLILSLAAGLGGYSLYHHWSDDGPITPGHAKTGPGGQLIGTRRADFTLKGLDGKNHSISEWDGEVLLINFWATWCPPCRREIPALVKIHRELSASGFSVIGAAMDDELKVSSYVSKYDVPYPNLIGQFDVSKVAALLGNNAGSLPYTVIIDRNGIIRYTHLGEISRKTAMRHIRPLLGAG